MLLGVATGVAQKAFFCQQPRLHNYLTFNPTQVRVLGLYCLYVPNAGKALFFRGQIFDLIKETPSI